MGESALFKFFAKDGAPPQNIILELFHQGLFHAGTIKRSGREEGEVCRTVLLPALLSGLSGVATILANSNAREGDPACLPGTGFKDVIKITLPFAMT